MSTEHEGPSYSQMPNNFGPYPEANESAHTLTAHFCKSGYIPPTYCYTTQVVSPLVLHATCAHTYTFHVP
jgi:hypothetical protein